MERRKFVVGLGALATGTAAATGTGALSSQESNRDVNVDVVADTNGTLDFSKSFQNLENSRYAEQNNGQMSLQFDSDSLDVPNSGRDAGGLNPDSSYVFDKVFQITNATPYDLDVSFDDSGLDNPDAFTFYAHYTNGTLIDDRDGGSVYDVASGGGLLLGVKIETPDSVPTDWETGSVTIVAERDDD